MRRIATVMAMVSLALVSCGDEAEQVPATDSTTVAPTSVVTTTPAPTTTTTTITITTSTTSTPAGVLECTTVAFTPNSEDAASDITATGLSCDEAESFVRRAGMQTSSGGPEEVDVDGFHCIRTSSQQDPLPRSSYECMNGPKTVTFVRS